MTTGSFRVGRQIRALFDFLMTHCRRRDPLVLPLGLPPDSQPRDGSPSDQAREFGGPVERLPPRAPKAQRYGVTTLVPARHPADALSVPAHARQWNEARESEFLDLWVANYKMAWDYPRNQRLISHVSLNECWLDDLGELAY